MLYPNVYVFAGHLRLIDAATMGLSAVAVWTFGFGAGWWTMQTQGPMLVFASSLVVAFLIVAGRLDVYRARRTERLRYELLALAEVAVLAIGVSSLATAALVDTLPGRIYALTGLLALTVLIGLRILVRAIVRTLRSFGKDMRWWLVVGRNERARRLIEEVRWHPWYGIRIAKIVDVLPKVSKQGTRTMAASSLAVDGVAQATVPDEQAFRALLEDEVIDEVVICLPIRSHYDEIERLARVCEDAGISVMLPPQVFDRLSSQSTVKYVGSIPMLAHWTGPSHWDKLLVKRLLDILGAGAALFILSPLMLAIAVAVKANSSGPIFFRQTRLGLHGRPFMMLKFRTMVLEAAQQREALQMRSEVDGPAFKIQDDSRITPVGKILRKYHLDELPQLWNVLVGDMSLVGPRPLPPREARGEEWWHRRRLSMPPGMTCLWQAQGDHRIAFADWMRLDLEYIDRWSLALDLRILAATVRTVLRGTGW